MAARLVTVPELSLWAEGDSTAIDPNDVLAQWILDQASTLVAEEAGILTWTAADAPGKAKIVVANVAKRCWNNADQELRSAIAGGPSSQVHNDAAYGLMLTEAEVAMIASIPAVKEHAGTDGGLWTLSTTRGPVESVLYFPDNEWPLSSPIGLVDLSKDKFYKPLDAPLPTMDPDSEPTNTYLEDDPVDTFDENLA